jgi:hypothetical protein
MFRTSRSTSSGEKIILRHLVFIILKQVNILKLQKRILWNMLHEVSCLQECNNSQ